ncbi:thioredoxin family protein [Bacillus massilinigeriensis]|uniref:thioredoxin family protein n=1 Tax=Bacillus mediterraneensis TaxID=1805474 RepID=UPI000AC67C95|nr:thioredoxin family protein [Bacillus mediterraneensis]
MTELSDIQLAVVDIEKVPEMAGFLMAFTAPVLVLYVDGKEALREARFVPVEKLRNSLHRIYDAAQ